MSRHLITLLVEFFFYDLLDRFYPRAVNTPALHCHKTAPQCKRLCTNCKLNLLIDYFYFQYLQVTYINDEDSSGPLIENSHESEQFVMSRNRISLGGSIRLHDLLEASDDEYGFVRNDIEKALDAREVTEEEIATPSKDVKDYKLPDEHIIPAGGEDRLTPSLTTSNSHDNLDQNDKFSISSTESGKKEDQSKIGALIDKAKKKTHKLVSGHSKKKTNSECQEDSLCTNISVNSLNASTNSIETMNDCKKPRINDPPEEVKPFNSNTKKLEPKGLKYLDPADPSDPFLVQSLVHKFRVLPFFRARMMIFSSLLVVTVLLPGFITGVLWGFYSTIIGFLYFFVSDPKPKEEAKDDWFLGDDDDEMVGYRSGKSVDEKIVDEAFGLNEGVVYRGWMNELRTRYSPATYHVNHAQSVLVRLEGSLLRICRPAKAVLKHAFYDDPTLKQSQPTMVSQVIYDLKDAHVSLRPKRLASRRWWSRKYPIHIRFSHNNSNLIEIDRSKSGASHGIRRSVSVAPYSNMQDLAEGANADSDGYTAESETDPDDYSASGESSNKSKILRANSASDINEFKNSGTAAKKRGRSIYLFVRAAREKERWFHLLREACARARATTDIHRLTSAASSSSLPEVLKAADEAAERVSLALDATNADQEKTEAILDQPKRERLPREYEFLKYRSNYASFIREISKIMSVQLPPKPERNSTLSVDLGTMKWQRGSSQISTELVDSINVLATRIFFDFCRDDFWVKQVKQKIQCKLATIHLPYFIEKLELSELKFGTKAPTITTVYTPKVDEWGTWVDFEMKFKGGIRLVLQTSVNLLKLQSGQQQVETEKQVSRWTESVRAARYSDSSLPESPESSPDEDFGSKNTSEGNTKERTGKKILSIVEKAAQSSLFQKAAKLHAVARLIEDVSTTPLMLNVEIEECEGPMTANIPPPPSDRLWYSFRHKPVLKIRAVPQVGDRSVDLSTVSEWIETKIRYLLEKNLVCPNMDDIILPVLSGNPLLHMGYNK